MDNQKKKTALRPRIWILFPVILLCIIIALSGCEKDNNGSANGSQTQNTEGSNDIADYMVITDFKLDITDSAPLNGNVEFVLSNESGEDLVSIVLYLRIYDEDGVMLDESVCFGIPATTFSDKAKVKCTGAFTLEDDMAYGQLFLLEGVDEYTSDKWIFPIE